MATCQEFKSYLEWWKREVGEPLLQENILVKRSKGDGGEENSLIE